MAESSIPGPDRAAILLMSLGEDTAAEILRHMGPKEVQRLGTAMATLEGVQREQVDAAIEHFTTDMGSQTGIGVGSEDYIRNVLTDALGEEKASGMIDRILLGANAKGLESLKWMDPRAIVELVRLEHPQIIAIVLSYLDSDQAAAVISELPEKMRSDVLMRVATLDGVQPAAMQELNDVLEQQLKGGSGAKSSSLGGVKAAANILNFVEGTVEASIMDEVKERDESLGTEIQDLMFVFDNLIDIDDRGIQVLLREISTDNLVLALKGVDDAMKDKFFKNMSQRAAEMLKDDLEAKGPVKLSEVEGAQKEILVIARRLSEEGQISMGGGGEELVG